ncbi:MAG: GatB/YqeY domain-containing protein [Pseudomonadales bacterium]|nr:GatB/YqeY domain-containing protein [Pseudomonadales bacterium]
MTDSSLKAAITESMKTAMRNKDKDRLAVIRLIQADIKRIEVDERIELDDARVLAVLDKMVKQRRDSITQFSNAGRMDLADKESYEVSVIQAFLPSPLTDAEIAKLVDDAITESGASGMQDMGKVMGLIKPKAQGRADMGAISGIIKQRLS